MVIRAGVDDRADGERSRNQHPADVRDRVLRRLGARRARRRDRRLVREPRARASTRNWLLNSLVVVIIGGMGSLGGAAVGLAAARDDDQLRRRVPAVGLHVLLDHLHVRAPGDRPRGAATRAVRETGMTSRALDRARRRRRGARRRDRGAAAVQHLLGVRAADADAAARHRRGEPDLPLRVRRHGLVRAGRARTGSRASCSATSSRTGTRRGSTSGWNPWLGVVLAIVIATAFGLLFGALASRSVGIYFLMITLDVRRHRQPASSAR